MSGARRFSLALAFCLLLALVGLGRGDSASARDDGAPHPLSHEWLQTSLELDGDGDYVQIDDDPALDLDDATGITIEAWVRRNNTGEFCEAVVGKSYLTSYRLGFCNDVIRFYSGGGDYQDGNTAVPAGAWTHVAVTWAEGGQRRYYINGDLDFVGAAGSAPADNSFSLLIGAAPGTFNMYEFSGNVAEVRVWRVSRSQDEIRRTMHVALEESRPGLVANWHLADDFQDNVGGHDGTAQGDASLSGPQAPPHPALASVDTAFNELPATLHEAATVYVPELDQAILIGGRWDGAVANYVRGVEAASGHVSPPVYLPGSRSLAAAAYAPSSGLIYVFGGKSSPSSNGTDTIYTVDPRTGATGVVAATLPTPVFGAAAVYHPAVDKIYLFGGSAPGANPTEILIFDPATESISVAPFSLPERRYSMGAAYSTATGNIYLFGGFATVETDTIYEVSVDDDGTAGAVTELSTTLPEADAAFDAVEDPFSKLIYLVGGGSTTHVRAFDPPAGELWQTPIGLEEKRVYPGVVYSPAGRHALVIGGREGRSGQDTIWRIPLGDGPVVPLGRWDFPEPAGAQVSAIDGDEDGVVVGTYGNSAWRYRSDGTREGYSLFYLGSSSGIVNDVAFDAANDEAWIATDDAGVTVDQESGKATYDSSDLGTNNVLSVEPPRFFGTDGQGLKWQHQASGGGTDWATNFDGQDVHALTHGLSVLWLLSGGQLRHMTYDNFGNSIEVSYGAPCNFDLYQERADLAFDGHDNWWIVTPPGEITRGGICYIEAAATPGTGNSLVPTIGRAARAVDTNSDGRIWIALRERDSVSDSGGLVTYQTSGPGGLVRSEEYNWLNAPIGSNNFHYLSNRWGSDFTAVGAADERVWAGKTSGGLFTFARRWQQLGESNDLASRAIEDVWTLRGRAFLATSDSLHVLMPDGKTWENRSGVKVWDMLGDHHGQIWAATDTGIRQYTPEGWDDLASVEGTRPSYATYALAQDQEGRVWIGGLQGLTLFDRGRFVTTFNAANSPLPDDTVRSLLVDGDNRLWVGTDAGLARLDGSDWTVFTTSDGLPDNAIYDLAQPADGQIAVSTAAGLSLYDGSSFAGETLPIPDSNLPLAVDQSGRLWAGSALRRGDQWQGYYWTNSGLRSTQVSAVAADDADRVWFGHAPDDGVSVRGSYLPPLENVIPILDGIAPDHGSSGHVLTISGNGFGNNVGNVSVTVGGAPVDVISIDDTAGGQELRVRLLNENRSGDVSVSVEGGPRTSLVDAFCAVPVINSFSPTGGSDGVRVVVQGTNFDEGARISLGGGPLRASRSRPTRLDTLVQPDAGDGPLRVENPDCGGDTYFDTSSTDFHHLQVNPAEILEPVRLNQGIESTGLVDDRRTMIQHFLSTGRGLRPDDRVQVDTVEVTITDPGSGNSQTEIVRTQAYSLTTPTTVGAPPPARFKDISNSVNVFVTPEIDGFNNGMLEIQTVLKRRSYTVTQSTASAYFRANQPMRALLVPVMPEGYTETDLDNMKGNIAFRADDLKQRLMPTGDVELIWSPTVFTPDQLLTRDKNKVDLGKAFQLYRASQKFNQARNQWNNNHDPDALIAFGAVHVDALASGSDSGKAFWPHWSQAANEMALDWLDKACDTVVKIATFGQKDCKISIPLYVGWAVGTGPNPSQLFGHEFGHTMGLVRRTASNWGSGNRSHSRNDELDGGECADDGATYNEEKTLYRQPGVSEPVVNVLEGKQYPAMLSDSRGERADRGKAIMSYACRNDDEHSFFEPVDVPWVMREFGMHSLRDFADVGLGPPPGASGTDLESTPAAADNAPDPAAFAPGPRIYVSGIVTGSTKSGVIEQVEMLDGSDSVSPDFTTAYELVQLDDSGTELLSTGIFPISSVSGDEEPEAAYFSATLLRQDGVARIELRHEGTLLDAFTAGSAAPTVKIGSPDGGFYSGGDAIPVAWSAGDADGDELSFTILYSHDGGRAWVPVAFSSGSDSVKVPAAPLAGSKDARIKVVASDGFHNGSATSAPFAVANQPPQAFIGNPADGSTFLEGRTVLLSGGALDNRDGRVAGSDLHWHSDRDGDLGGGETLEVFLSVGTHVITLEAENSVGLTDRVSTTITIEGDYDGDGISDAGESSAGLNPLTAGDAYGDADGDGLTLVVERKRNLDPNNPDTDGDGRNDGLELAEGSDPATSDAPLPPDALAITPERLSFEADLAQDNPWPQQTVHVSSRRPVSWTLSADVPWLVADAAEGSTPAGPMIAVDVSALDDGTHGGNLTFESADLGNVTVPVSVTVNNSEAYVDVNGDGDLNVGDVQDVAWRIPSSTGDAGFHYRRDPDRDGDVDIDDALLMADRWMRGRHCCVTPPPASGATLHVDAPPGVSGGQTFVAEIHVDGAAGLGGFEFDLTFDPAVLAVQNVSLGAFPGSSGRTVRPLGPVIDNDAGTVAFGGYTSGVSAAPDGSGVLARITFRAVAEGQSALTLQGETALLAAVDGALTSPAVAGDTVDVSSFVNYLPVMIRP